MEQLRVDSSTVLLRTRVKLSSNVDGFAALMSGNGMTLGVGHRDGMWTMACLSADGSEWLATDFSMSDSDSDKWLNIDIVRMSGRFAGYGIVFVNGALVNSLIEVRETDMQPQCYEMGFATVEVGEMVSYGEYPPYVVRALRKFGLSGNAIGRLLEREGGCIDAVSHRREVLSDEERMGMRNYCDFMVDANAGDLSFSERTWFMSRTVNREYYSYSDAFDISRAPLDATGLVLLGADYLPTVQGRSWEGEVVYEDWSDYYIEKIYGYIVPKESGKYSFHITGDDEAALYLSPDAAVEDAVLVALVRTPTVRRGWTKHGKGASRAVSMNNDTAYYFELWHVERAGNDHVALGWISPDSNGEVVPVPSCVISSFTGKAPGSMSRNVAPPDPSLIGVPLTWDAPAFSGARYMSLATNGTLLGGSAILASDFSTNSYPYHAYEGEGLGFVYCTPDWFPTMYSYLLDDYVWYSGNTVNPQVFYDYDNEAWMKFYVSGGVRLEYMVASTPGICTFESGFGDWVNDASGDTNDWTLDSSGTPTGNTGPVVDHTKGTSAGYYLYMETSSGAAYTAGNTAILVGPSVLPGTQGLVVAFHYHMYGANIGTLYLEKRTEYEWVPVWSLSGQQQTSGTEAFRVAQVVIPSNNGKPVKLRFRGVAAGGGLGDMAIDDVILCDVGSDTDGDGIPDGLELLLSGNLSTYGGATDLLSDSDRDLYSAASEILGGKRTDSYDLSITGDEAINSALNSSTGPLLLLNNGNFMKVNTATMALSVVNFY